MRILPSIKKGGRKPKPLIPEDPNSAVRPGEGLKKRVASTTDPNSGVRADEFKSKRKRKRGY